MMTCTLFRIICRGWLCSLMAYALFAVQVHAAKTVDLRCEYTVNPMGIDEPQPQLSWRMESNQSGEIQTVYRILVARSKEKLDQYKGDLWDSGKVMFEEESGNMIIKYQYRRRKDHASVGLIYTIYHGTDLTSWSSTGDSEVGTADIQGKSDYELVTVEITIPVGTPESARHFAYLKVEQR